MRNGTPYPYLVGMHAGTVEAPAHPSTLPVLNGAEEMADPEVLAMIRRLSPMRLADLAITAMMGIHHHSPKAEGSPVDAGIVENDLVAIKVILSELARRAEVRS